MTHSFPAPHPTDSAEARVDHARLIIARAADLALEYFRHLDRLTIERKSGPDDMVSQADRGVEALLRNEITSAFPEDAILGEEGGHEPGKSGWTWVIDPIDGTTPFLHGLPSWTVVLALLHHGQPVAGLIAEPCRDRLYWARQGLGAWLEGEGAPRRLACLPARSLAGQAVACGPGAPRHAAHVGQLVTRLTEARASFMRNGSAALSLALVASGHYAGFHEAELSAWDCLAGQLLVAEAGGRNLPFDLTRPQARQPVTSAAPGVYDALMALTRP